MRKLISLSVLTMLLLSISAISFAQGYNIKVQIKGLENSEIYMGHYFADKTYVKDTVQTDATGTAVFKGDEKIDGGLYFIVLPSKSIAWEFLLTDDQEFTMTSDTSDYIKNLKVTGSTENDLYFDYVQFMREMNILMADLQDRMKAAQNDEAKTTLLKSEAEGLQATVKNSWKKYVKDNPGTFFATLVNAQMFPEPPEFTISPEESNPDSVKQVRAFYYNKKHFFDNINFADARILRTAHLFNRLQTFFTKMVLDPDTIIKDGDRVIKQAEANDDVYRYVVEYLLNLKYETKRMGMDKVLVHMGEEYYLSGKATWVDSTRMAKIEERVRLTRPNIIGNKAEDLKMATMDNKIINLYNIPNDYIVIAFWEPNCGHCKKVIPRLHEIYTDLRWTKNISIEVFAVLSQANEQEKWQEFLEEHDYTDWINAWDPYNWSNFRKKYDIYSTPTIYLLNKKKEIIAKRLDIENLEEFITNYEKYRK